MNRNLTPVNLQNSAAWEEGRDVAIMNASNMKSESESAGKMPNATFQIAVARGVALVCVQETVPTIGNKAMVQKMVNFQTFNRLQHWLSCIKIRYGLP